MRGESESVTVDEEVGWEGKSSGWGGSDYYRPASPVRGRKAVCCCWYKTLFQRRASQRRIHTDEAILPRLALPTRCFRFSIWRCVSKCRRHSGLGTTGPYSKGKEKEGRREYEQHIRCLRPSELRVCCWLRGARGGDLSITGTRQSCWTYTKYEMEIGDGY